VSIFSTFTFSFDNRWVITEHEVLHPYYDTDPIPGLTANLLVHLFFDILPRTAVLIILFRRTDNCFLPSAPRSSFASTYGSPSDSLDSINTT
jgi:hypothetical protein